MQMSTPDTPKAPDPPLVDPETGETAPLSPQQLLCQHLTVCDSLPPFCATCGKQLEEGPDDAA
jgi:hypothetical protein